MGWYGPRGGCSCCFSCPGDSYSDTFTTSLGGDWELKTPSSWSIVSNELECNTPGAGEYARVCLTPTSSPESLYAEIDFPDLGSPGVGAPINKYLQIWTNDLTYKLGEVWLNNTWDNPPVYKVTGEGQTQFTLAAFPAAGDTVRISMTHDTGNVWDVDYLVNATSEKTYTGAFDTDTLSGFSWNAAWMYLACPTAATGKAHTFDNFDSAFGYV